MFPTKFNLVTAGLLALGLGLGLSTQQARADKPDAKPAADKPAAKPDAKPGAPAADKPAAKPDAKPGAPAADNADKKGPKNAGPVFYATVKSVDAAKKTLTVKFSSKDKNEPAIEKTYDLTPDAAVQLPAASKEQSPAGKLSDLAEGSSVILTLSADGKSVSSITVQAPNLSGQVKAVDAGKNTITVTVVDKKQQQSSDKTYAVAPDAHVMLPGNDKSKNGGKLADLAAGTPVTLRLTLDQKTVLGIAVQGPKGPGKKEAPDKK